MEQKKKLIPKKYLLTFILVTSLFALWGFANDITNPMVGSLPDRDGTVGRQGLADSVCFLWRLCHDGHTGSVVYQALFV